MKQTIAKSALKRITTVWLICLASLPAIAQTSTYSSMTLAGDFQGWNPGAKNMVLVSNNVWETTIAMTASRTNEFKFAANGNWNVNWGAAASQTTNTLVPIAQTGVVSSANNIRIGNVRDGIYRYRFNSATREFWVDRIGNVSEYTNLLRNPGFETEGSSSYDAQYWENGYPDGHGDNWGNSFREKWRQHSGTWMGAIGALNTHFGGWWQECAAGPDFDIDLSGYFYTDPGWTSAVRELKVEFYDNAYNFLGNQSLSLTGLTNTYALRQFTASVPANTTWARLVVYANDTGNSGTMEFDDMALQVRSRPTQSFTAWDFANYVGQHTRGGWSISNGFVSQVNGRSVLSANLKNDGASSATGGYITSGKLTNGVGLVTFWYRNGWLDEDSQPAQPVSFDLFVSNDGINFTPAGSQYVMTNILNDYYLPYTAQLTNSASAQYLRIRHSGGSTNLLVIDDIAISKPSSTLLYQDFELWPTNNPDQSSGWIVKTGIVSTVNAYSGQSAMLKPSVPLFANYIQSPQYASGIGRVSFYYARGTNGTGQAVFAVQSSTDGTSWTTLDTVDQILATGYQLYERSFVVTAPSYLRIVNLIRTNTAGGSGAVLISEGFSGGATPPTDWTFNSILTYESSGNFGEAVPSLRFDASNDYIITSALVGNPTGITFWAKGQSINAASILRIEGTTNNGATWSVVSNMSGFSNSGTIYDVPVANTNFTRLKFTYLKAGGNMSFDDLRITGATGGGGSQPAQGLYIDNISVTDPIEYRNQNFEEWPTHTSYGEYEFQGWKAVKRAIIDSQNAYDGQVLRLDNSSGLSPYIQSPLLSEGIGSISFQYRNWDGSPSINAQLQISADGTNWSTAQNFAISATNYTLFEKSFNTTTAFAMRIFLSSGSERALIDNIVVSKPQPAAQLSINASILPSYPYTNDPVHILANYAPSYGAYNIGMTSFYRVGTSGAFTAIGMVITNFVQYGTTNPIPKQTTNTIVQYYVKATFSGPGSDLTSPVYYPPGGPTNPASYGVPRNAPGSVWINEVKYNDFLDFFFTVGFVELAGKAGVNVSGWKIDFVQLQNTNFLRVIGSYNITNSTYFQDDYDGFGFWVLGNENTTPRQQTLTNNLYTTPLGIRLLNEMGYVEQALSFEGSIFGYSRVSGIDLDYYEGLTGLSLTGTGLTYSAFGWTEMVTNTPGEPNRGQIFGLPVVAVTDPPDMFQLTVSNGNIYVFSDGNTNSWNVAPYYVTNIMSTPQNWQPVTPFNNSATFNGTNVIWFAVPSNGNSYIYRMMYTKP